MVFLKSRWWVHEEEKKSKNIRSTKITGKNLIQRAIHIDRKVVSISDPVIYEQLGLSVFTIE